MLFASLNRASQIVRHENPEISGQAEEKSCTAIYFDQVRHISSLARRAA